VRLLSRRERVRVPKGDGITGKALWCIGERA